MAPAHVEDLPALRWHGHPTEENAMIGWIYEMATGRPWLTVRSMRDEFGPPPAEHFAAELAGLSDGELIAGPQRRAPRRPPLPRGPDGASVPVHAHSR